MHASALPLKSRVAGPLALGGVLGVLIAGLSWTGLPEQVPGMFGPVTVLSTVLSAGLVACGYVLGGVGLARPLAAVLAAGSPNRHWLQLGLGLGLMLWLSHMLGMLGLLSGEGVWPRVVGWGVASAGLMMLLDQMVRPGGTLRPERWPVLPVSSLVWAPGLALLVVAACNPPGALWRSEFGAFDALSYHLQLPKEWAAGDRLWPSEHNVYSYLPSLVEAGYLHLGAMMPGLNEPVARMIGGEGMWILGTQLLHGLCAIVAALVSGRLGWALAERVGAPALVRRTIGVISGALVLCTPWTIVVGSLAYTEAALLAMFAGGALAAMDERLGPGRRAVLAGVFVGLACGCKPTALLFAGPTVGALLLMHAPGPRIKPWVFTVLLGSLGGLLAIGPWLVRNALASGNPVFPFAASVLGSGHWTSEQVARHAANHHAPPGMGLGDRVMRLLSSAYGLRHEQYAIMVLVLALGCGGALAWKRSRGLAAVVLAGTVIQAVCWMGLTHMQSRFLMTMLVPTAMVLALAGCGLVAWVSRGRTPERSWGVTIAALVVLALAPLSQAGRSILLFLTEDGGTPNRLLVFGPGALTGANFAGELARSSGQEREAIIDRLPTPDAYLNLVLAPQTAGRVGEGVYLLGDSTPLYTFNAVGGARAGVASTVVYHTTWDASPLGSAMAAAPGDPRAWSLWLREMGVRYVLVNFDELARLVTRDRYYDSRVTPENLRLWLTSPSSGLERVRAWPSPGAGEGVMSGRALVRITIDQPDVRESGVGP